MCESARVIAASYTLDRFPSDKLPLDTPVTLEEFRRSVHHFFEGKRHLVSSEISGNLMLTDFFLRKRCVPIGRCLVIDLG